MLPIEKQAFDIFLHCNYVFLDLTFPLTIWWQLMVTQVYETSVTEERVCMARNIFQPNILTILTETCFYAHIEQNWTRGI